MNRFILGGGLLAVALIGKAQVVIPSTDYNNTNAPTVVSSGTTITAPPATGGTVTVRENVTVIYQAPVSVTLKPGFTAKAGSKFFARIGPATTDSDGDLIPDAWEIAYGLNPNNGADAALLVASGGMLTNLQAYQQSLSPLALSAQALQGAPLPAGVQLVILTPENRAYGIDTGTYQISRVPIP